MVNPASEVVRDLEQDVVTAQSGWHAYLCVLINLAVKHKELEIAGDAQRCLRNLESRMCPVVA